jgi:hypothetical protein
VVSGRGVSEIGEEERGGGTMGIVQVKPMR